MRTRSTCAVRCVVAVWVTVALGCGGSGGQRSDGGGDAGADGMGVEDASQGDAGVLPDVAVSDGSVDAGGQPGTACTPLPPPQGTVIEVGPSQVDELPAIVAQAATGTTILLLDGTYMLSGGDAKHRLSFTTPGVTLRGKSGQREAVILDGNYATSEIISIAASDVTIADLTVRRAYNHPIHITGGPSGDITGVLLHNVRVSDPGQQAIKINPSAQGHYADQGRIECSLIELTAEGRQHVRDNCYTGGIDAHAAWGWQVRLNTIRGFWCLTGLSEHGIHFWRASRDTLVERNQVLDCARGIGFGLGESGTGQDRVYADNPYAGVGYLGHVDGIIRNNFVWATISGHDSGISLEQSRGTLVVHNSVVSIERPFSSIEWRWDHTSVRIVNNLVSHELVARDGATAEQEGNITYVNPVVFVNAVGGDLHLNPTTAAIAVDKGAPLDPGVCDEDIDGESRSGPRDVGADEL